MAALNYHSTGEGEVIVLLHAIGLDHHSWGHFRNEMTENHHVISVDLRGHGQSPAAVSGYRLGDYAQDVLNLLDSLNISTANFLGLSFGGMVTQHLALKAPKLVARLMLCGCPGGFPPEARQPIAERGTVAERGGMEAIIDTTLARWFTPDFVTSGGTKAVRERLLSDDVAGWAAGWAAISQHDVRASLSAISAPTLCVAGARDEAVSPKAVRALADAIPGAIYVELADAPHIMHFEQPDSFSTAITHFLKG